MPLNQSFDLWDDLGRIVPTAVLVYIALVVALRVTGKRSLSKWNAFDFVVTVALGSVLATGVISRTVTALDAVLGLAALVGLQYAVTWLAVRVKCFRRLIKSEPVLLVFNGVWQHDAMLSARVPQEELLAAMRSHGVAQLRDVGAIVLETNGTFSLLRELGDGPAEGLRDVAGYEYTPNAAAPGERREPG